MIDFLEQHGFEPLEQLQLRGEVADFHEIWNGELGVIVGLDFDEKEIQCVYLAMYNNTDEDDDFDESLVHIIQVPNCDNKLALYTLLHNFNLLPR